MSGNAALMLSVDFRATTRKADQTSGEERDVDQIEVSPASEVLERLRRYARERLKDSQADLFLPFLDRYYGRIDAADLVARSLPDLFGVAFAHLRLGMARRRGETRLAVYSPNYDEHGFAVPHTVIEIVTDDMPFLVDSVTMELRRHGLGLHAVIHPVVAVRRGPDG